VWLNAWGCRIRLARDGERDVFDVGIARWWRQERDALSDISAPLAMLADEEIEALAKAFAALTSTTVATTRTMGPTGSAKLLYALRPATVMPWDQRIAEGLHGGRDAKAFADHLRLGRSWASGLLATSGLDETHLVASLGRDGASLAKVLDEYCFVRYARRG
jgi:hypothetical protein